MAQSLSAEKRIRQNEKHRQRNRSYRTRLRTEIKKMRKALESSDKDDAKKLMPSLCSVVDVMVKKGIIHKNTGNRYKSRLNRKLSSIVSS